MVITESSSSGSLLDSVHRPVHESAWIVLVKHIAHGSGYYPIWLVSATPCVGESYRSVKHDGVVHESARIVLVLVSPIDPVRTHPMWLVSLIAWLEVLEVAPIDP